jgi:hypothetical protein
MNKKEKIKTLQNMKKKRGITKAELSPPQIMRKKIKNNTNISPPKKPKRTKTKFIIEDIPLSPKQSKRIKTKFIIEDIPSPPKQPKRMKTKFIIEDIPMLTKQLRNTPPKQLSNTRTKAQEMQLTTQNPCCSCRKTRTAQTRVDCYWCQLHHHFDMCVSNNTKRK